MYNVITHVIHKAPWCNKGQPNSCNYGELLHDCTYFCCPEGILPQTRLN